MVTCLQGQKDINVFAAACKALATASAGKAAAKRAGKALEKVHCHSTLMYICNNLNAMHSRGAVNSD